MLFSGAKRRIISKEAREFAILGGNEWIDDISYAPDSPIVLNYLKYAEYLGIKPEQIKVTLPPRTEEQIKKIDDLLSGLDRSKPLIVIAPATTWKNKHWNKDNWKTVVDNLKDRCNIVFTGGPNDSELIEYINQGRYLNLAGKTDIIELMELFSRANLVMAPDSGSAHLAWATGKPAVITIFTCTPKEVLAPLGDGKKYIALGGKGLVCQPCFKRKCKLHKNIDIQKLFSGSFKRKQNSCVIADAVYNHWCAKIKSVDFINEFSNEDNFDSSIMANLIEQMVLTSGTLSIADRMAGLISDYVNVIDIHAANESLISDILADVIQDFVLDFGFEYLSDEEKASAKKVCQNRKIPAFNFIEKEMQEIVGEAGLTALFNEMSTNPKALLPSFEDNYHKWLEYMFISFVATLEIPDYDPEANMVLEILLKKIKVA